MTSYFNACDVTVTNSNDKFSIIFWRALVPPHFEKGSATYARLSAWWSQGATIAISYKVIVTSRSCGRLLQLKVHSLLR